MKKYIGFIAGLLLLAAPSIVMAASTHNYVCADFSAAGSASCSNNIITGTGGGMNDATPTFPLTTGKTWYFTAGYTSGSYRRNCNGGTCTNDVVSGAVSDLSFTVSATTGLFIQDISGGNFVAGPFCVTDTPGSCVTASAPIFAPLFMLFGDWN